MMDSASDVASDVTLEDDAWKDSFDKLLEPRPVLRALNVLKKNVRASFNINSSVESNSNENSTDLHQMFCSPYCKQPLLQPPKFSWYKTASSPFGKEGIKNPFKCTLSPITNWKTIHYEPSVPSELESEGLIGFHATLINPEVLVADYDSENLNGNKNTETVRRTDETILTEIVAQFSIEEVAKTACRKTKLGRTESKQKRKSSQKRVLFESVKENLQCKSKKPNKAAPRTRSTNSLRKLPDQRPKSLVLQSGKWRKSLNVWRRTQISNAQNRHSDFASKNADSAINISAICVGRRKSVFLKPELQSEVSHSLTKSDERVWQQRVLSYCVKNTIIDFLEAYGHDKLANCIKIGEGAYGEVFMMEFDDASKNTVLKIIPIEGKDLINGEVQKSFEQILPEIVMSLELSKLSELDNAANSTSGFVGIKKVACVRGKYPSHLLDLWEAYDEENGSENDNPATLPSEQLFIVLELSYGGKDLEKFVFNNAEQSYYALQQVVLTLAVGEASYQFEHRDLHWGNILIATTKAKSVMFKLNEKSLTLPTKGVKTTIIDYTLSRMNYADYCYYNDLSNDQDLFAASGDYQFDIYRLMRDALKNDWRACDLRTNVFWISYIIQKMLNDVAYKSTRTKTHTIYINKLKELEEIVLDFDSALSFAKHLRKI